MSPKSQHITHFLYAKPVYSISMSPTIDLTVKESQKDNVVEEDDLGKLTAIEERMGAIERNYLYGL